METRKIVSACFVGGSVCVLALLLAPAYWYLDLAAGFAAGYLAFEFREVLKAIPVALGIIGMFPVIVLQAMIRAARKWLSKPHPFIYLASAIVIPFVIWSFSRLPALEGGSTFEVIVMEAIMLFLTIIYCGAGIMFLLGFWRLFAFIGSSVGERCFWQPFLSPANERERALAIMTELMVKGYVEKELTLRNGIRWFFKGLGVSIFYAVTSPGWLLVGVGYVLFEVVRSLWRLFKIIHSHKRLLCGIDGTIGGALIYLQFGQEGMSLMEKAVLIIVGGLIGAAIGVFNWEIISKKVLKVVPATS